MTEIDPTTGDDLDLDGDEGDKTPEEGTPEEDDDAAEKKDDKPKRDVNAQRKHWRKKAQDSSKKVADLEAELSKLKDLVKKPTDEKERAAQDYIRTQAREVFDELQRTKDLESAKHKQETQDKIDAVLDENPDVAEEELLDVMEELDVEPDVALKILQRETTKTEKKPRLPKSRRAAVDEPKAPADDSKKSMWDILREETSKAIK